MAAHAVHQVRTKEPLEVTVLSRKEKSPIHGCQYLHRPIPDMTPRTEQHVTYRLRGDAGDYRTKVYGNSWFSGSVSPEDLIGEHTAWDIRQTYDNLWATYEHLIQDVTLDPGNLENVIAGADLVINSIPRPMLCRYGHTFRYASVIAAGEAPQLGIKFNNLFQCPDNMVVCNGEDSPSWYRMARVFGHLTIEWPEWVRQVPITTATVIQKPLDHNCDCWPTLVDVGRYGKWEKGVLSHTAYFDAMRVVEDRAA
jgi:hypothetical protein